MKLTKAQVAGLEWLYVDGSPRRNMNNGKGLGVYEPALATLRSLVRCGMARRVARAPAGSNHFSITEAGRAALTETKL